MPAVLLDAKDDVRLMLDSLLSDAACYDRDSNTNRYPSFPPKDPAGYPTSLVSLCGISQPPPYDAGSRASTADTVTAGAVVTGAAGGLAVGDPPSLQPVIFTAVPLIYRAMPLTESAIECFAPSTWLVEVRSLGLPLHVLPGKAAFYLVSFRHELWVAAVSLASDAAPANGDDPIALHWLRDRKQMSRKSLEQRSSGRSQSAMDLTVMVRESDAEEVEDEGTANNEERGELAKSLSMKSPKSEGALSLECREDNNSGGEAPTAALAGGNLHPQPLQPLSVNSSSNSRRHVRFRDCTGLLAAESGEVLALAPVGVFMVARDPPKPWSEVLRKHASAIAQAVDDWVAIIANESGGGGDSKGGG